MKIRDSVVVPVSAAIQNGAAILIDSLQVSINKNAPSLLRFLEIILNYKKFQNAPFRASLLDMINLELQEKCQLDLNTILLTLPMVVFLF